jgi:hypothetical protein
MIQSRYIKAVDTASPIEPLKVYYNRIEFNESTPYRDGDEQYWRVNGINDYIASLPENAVLQRLDPFEEDKLHYFNKWGHKWRFTSSNGGYWDNVTNQWKDKFGTVTTQALAFPPLASGNALISCLLSGLQWSNNMPAITRNWTFYLNEQFTYNEGGYSDWFAPNQGTSTQLIGGQKPHNTGLWNVYRFPFVGWQRSGMWTCSTYRVGTGIQAMTPLIYGNIGVTSKANQGTAVYCRQENNDFVIQP